MRAIARVVATIAIVTSLPAAAASFDCAKAASQVEHLVCASPRLSRLDDELGALYKRLLEYYKGDASFKNGQRQWVAQSRNRCQDEACLATAYEARIEGFRTGMSQLGIKADDIAENAMAESTPAAASRPPGDAAPPVARSPVPKSTTQAGAGTPTLSKAEAQEIFDLRAGRCAAQAARAGGSERGEYWMSLASNRLRTRTAYAQNWKLSSTDKQAALEESMDACRALGLVDGEHEKVSPDHLTDYEIAHRQGNRQDVDARMADHVAGAAQREADAQAVREANVASDPVARLRAAYLGMDARCRTIWRDSTSRLLLQIDQLGPRNPDNPNSTVERTARGVAEPQLNAMRSTGCAK